MDEDLKITDRITIPAAELSWRFDTSGGPGGQHANRSATRAELVFDLVDSPAFDEASTALVLQRLGSRVAGGVVTVVVDDTRSQWRNRRLARRRMADLLAEALRPLPVRRKTRPSGGSVRRRLEAKRRRSETKELRRRPGAEE